MKCLRMVALAAVLVLSVAPALQAQTSMTRKVDSFDFLVDYSGSMMMTHATLKENKMELAKQILTAVNDTIPNLGYMSSMHTIAPVGTTSAYGSWDSAAMGRSISSLSENMAIYGRLTPIGDGFMSLSGAYSSMARPTAVVLVSDGLNNIGSNPVAQAQALYAANPGLCIHIISLADDAAGKAILNNIAALNSCTVMVEGADLLASQANVDQFVADVFYTDGFIDTMVLRGVNFAFDSYALDAQSKAILDEVAAILLASPGKVTLEGWTDYIGTDAYNATLSLRRAQAVRDYLITKGVPAADLTAVGMGKSYKYDNSTDQGRYLNRRTELLFN